MSTSWTRQSYEAAVLLIPLDREARNAVETCAAEALAGVTVASAGMLADHAAALIEQRNSGVISLAGSPAAEGAAASSSRLEIAVHGADIVIVLAHDLTAVDGAAVVRIGDAARSTGRVLGAVVISPDLRWHDEASHTAAAALREAADTVVVLSDLSPALAFLQVLRGGERAQSSIGAAS